MFILKISSYQSGERLEYVLQKRAKKRKTMSSVRVTFMYAAKLYAMKVYNENFRIIICSSSNRSKLVNVCPTGHPEFIGSIPILFV